MASWRARASACEGSLRGDRGDDDIASAARRGVVARFLDQIDGLSKKIAELEKATVHEAARGATTRRLQTMPGVGPITAMAIETFAPPMTTFKRGRDFAAWLGLVPRQHRPAASSFSENVEDGTTRHSAIADHRRDRCCALGLPEGSARRNVAPSHAGTQAAHASGNRAR